MKKTLSILAILFVTLAFSVPTVFAAPPDRIKGDMFICPSVSPKNPNSMWILGGSGAYNVILPATNSPNWPMFLNPFLAVEENPADVEGQAQVKAGWGLYHKLPTYPYYQGPVMVLEDAVDFIKEISLAQGSEIDIIAYVMGMLIIMPSDGVPYIDTTTTPDTLYLNVPLASAVFW